MSRKANGLVRTVAAVLLVVMTVGCSQAPATPAKPSAASDPGSAPAANAPAAAAPAAPASPLPRLRVAYLAPVGSMAPLWMAKESGAFERVGVPVEVVLIQANAVIAALIAGEIDLVQVSAPPVVTAGVQDADITFIAGALNNMIHSVHVRPDVGSAAGLKGKLFGSDRPGTPNDFATVRGLEKLGLHPADVQVLAIGSSEQLLVALLSGQLAGTVLAPPQSFAAGDAGYPALTDLYDVSYQTIGIAGLRSRLPALEPSLLPFLRAYRAGMERYDTDKAFAMKVLDDYGRIGDPAILERTYDFYKTRGWNRSLTVSDAGVQNVIDFVAKSVPAAQGVTAERFIERRYVQQLGPN